MKFEDAAEPIESDVTPLKCAIDEWDSIASQIIERMDADIVRAGSENWRPHHGQIVAVVSRFQELCRDVLSRLSFASDDREELFDAYARVWEQADQLVKWLNRMV